MATAIAEFWSALGHHNARNTAANHYTAQMRACAFVKNLNLASIVGFHLGPQVGYPKAVAGRQHFPKPHRIMNTHPGNNILFSANVTVYFFLRRDFLMA